MWLKSDLDLLRPVHLSRHIIKKNNAHAQPEQSLFIDEMVTWRLWTLFLQVLMTFNRPFMARCYQIVMVNDLKDYKRYIQIIVGSKYQINIESRQEILSNLQHHKHQWHPYFDPNGKPNLNGYV